MPWRRLNGEMILLPLNKAVEQAIIREQNCGHNLKLCIGSDSMIRGSNIEFATVIVFLREKKGGFMFIHHSREKNIISLKERMIMEVSKSVQVAYSICEILDQYNVDLEVHADINTDPGFASHSALKEAMGYIMGMGFVFKAKPFAFASSSCADKML